MTLLQIKLKLVHAIANIASVDRIQRRPAAIDSNSLTDLGLISVDPSGRFRTDTVLYFNAIVCLYHVCPL